MTTTDQLTTSQRIQIWERLQLVAGEAGKEGVYTCRVADIKEDQLYISRPAFEYGNSLLANNRQVTVHFTRADAAYTFSARLQEMEPKSSDAMILLDLGEVKRLQRRRFVRLDLVVPVKYKTLPRPIKAEIKLEADAFTSVRSFNLSAGGLLMPVNEDVTMAGLLLLDMSKSGLKSMPKLVLAARRQLRKLDDGKYVAGIEFILKEDMRHHLNNDEQALLPREVMDFDDRKQNKLVSELFAEQLVLRQKGLL